MPVDPTLLMKYEGTLRPPRSRRRRPWVPLAILGGGIALIGLVWLFGHRSGSVMAGLAITGAVLAAALGAYAMLEGWQEDGFVGMVYKARHPFGTAIAGDEEGRPIVWILWTLAFSAILVGVIGWWSSGASSSPPPSA